MVACVSEIALDLELDQIKRSSKYGWTWTPSIWRDAIRLTRSLEKTWVLWRDRRKEL